MTNLRDRPSEISSLISKIEKEKTAVIKRALYLSIASKGAISYKSALSLSIPEVIVFEDTLAELSGEETK